MEEAVAGEVIASSVITADMSGSDFGWLQIDMKDFQQCIQLTLMPRHFGGGQRQCQPQHDNPAIAARRSISTKKS